MSRDDDFFRLRQPQQGPTHRAIDELMRFRVAPDGSDRRVDGPEKFAAETTTFRVVPRVCVIKIKRRLPGETKSPYLRRSSLARTSSPGLAADGLRACARRRRASSFRCASVTGMISGVATRLSRSSSISSSRSSTLSMSACFSTVLTQAFSAASLQAARIISVRITARLSGARSASAEAGS